MQLAFSNLIISAVPIVRRLREHHFEAFFVGGAVRDTVLGLPIKDVDIATSATPEQVLALFDHCIPTGLQHGTITVVEKNVAYEVTTFRQESAYEGHRKPESVLYITELEGDLLRRDFTMNAMALAENGELHDPYGGLRDLELKQLRSVGDPNARFQEDALRMLRAVRFIGVYRLRPSHRTWRALKQHRQLLRFIAMERVLAELDKMMESESPQRALHFAVVSGLLAYLKEPLSEETQLVLHQADPNIPAMKKTFENIHELKQAHARWAAVAIGLKLSKSALLQALQVLRFSNARLKSISSIADVHYEMFDFRSDVSLSDQKRKWLSIVIHYGRETTSEWLTVTRLLPEAALRLPAEQLSDLERWSDQMIISKLKQLNVNGKELAGYLAKETGPWISEYLTRLLLLVACGELTNEKSILLEQAALWEVNRHEL
ncbi:CCA tRNA nucleotidyltransferase [Paenibacillus sp. 2TAB23]|uniref:CCA tRNA nucleotidyltransferase n=1 Tax=Paenibacillus sp. 2TAB23 TaxID=3233004 RepID=UPI003F9E976C